MLSRAWAWLQRGCMYVGVMWVAEGAALTPEAGGEHRAAGCERCRRRLERAERQSHTDLRSSPAMQLWGSLVAARRLLCSTPSDDFNREMAEFFGMTHPPGGSAASAGATASQPAAAAAGGQESGLVAEVQEFNAELFGVLGAPQQEDAAGAGQPQTVGQLAQRLAAAVGDGVQPAAGQAAAMQLSSRCSSSNGSFASSAGAAAVSINSSDDGRNAKLTHVDATGRASMVDVSHVSVPCCWLHGSPAFLSGVCWWRPAACLWREGPARQPSCC